MATEGGRKGPGSKRMRHMCECTAITHPLGRLAIVLAFVGIWANSLLAQTVTDGDTLKQGGVTNRLWGIDAPELAQICSDGWPAGRMAATRLQALTAGRSIVCQEKDHDRYGRTVAICRASGEDLGAALVREGMAWAFVRYSGDYVGQEAKAKADRARRPCPWLPTCVGVASAASWLTRACNEGSVKLMLLTVATAIGPDSEAVGGLRQMTIMNWQPIDDAPQDGTTFIALIERADWDAGDERIKERSTSGAPFIAEIRWSSGEWVQMQDYGLGRIVAQPIGWIPRPGWAGATLLVGEPSRNDGLPPNELFTRCGHFLCGPHQKWKEQFASMLMVKTNSIDNMSKGTSRVPPAMWREIADFLRQRSDQAPELLRAAIEAAEDYALVLIKPVNIGRAVKQEEVDHVNHYLRSLRPEHEFSGGSAWLQQGGSVLVRVPRKLTVEAIEGLKLAVSRVVGA